MKFVRAARDFSEQNLVLTQEGDKLFFSSIKNIHPNQELKAGYSEAYAKSRGLHYLLPADCLGNYFPRCKTIPSQH